MDQRNFISTLVEGLGSLLDMFVGPARFIVEGKMDFGWIGVTHGIWQPLISLAVYEINTLVKPKQTSALSKNPTSHILAESGSVRTQLRRYCWVSNQLVNLQEIDTRPKRIGQHSTLLLDSLMYILLIHITQNDINYSMIGRNVSGKKSSLGSKNKQKQTVYPCNNGVCRKTVIHIKYANPKKALEINAFIHVNQ